MAWKTRTKCGAFSEQQPSGGMHRMRQVRREREIKRDRTPCRATFRGRADERIVNFIYRAPQIRLTSSLTIKMIVEPLDRERERERTAGALCIESASPLRSPRLSAFRARARARSSLQKYSSLVGKVLSDA